MKNKSLTLMLAAGLYSVSLVASSNKVVPPARFDAPIMGWSSWNTYRVNINEALIKKQADTMVAKGLKEAGYLYINTDDGFFGWRDEAGKMHSHPERFPNGMKVVVDHIHSLGLKAGIYSDAGSNTCGSIWDNDARGVGAGLYGHERLDADLYFNEWGFDFIKIDYCGAGQTLELEEEKRYTEIREAIDAVSKKNVSLNICRWAYPGTWAKKLARSWRISGDINPSWGSIKHIIDKNLYLAAYAGGGHYNDMDMLEIGRGLPPNEEQVHFGMWCIMSSPLLIGCDLTTIPEPSLKLLKNKELIALNQDRLGLQAYVVQHNNAGYVLVKDIEQKRGKVRAVALYNPSDTICSFSVALNTLEMSGNVKVRDLILQKNLESIKGNLEQKVPAHSALFFRLEAEQRIEPNHYEAEWAYLPCYNDLGKSKRIISYVPMKEASGGMKVAYLGGSKENYAEWNEVYSKDGGRYEMTIRYVADKDRKLEVTVNGKKTMVDNLNSDPKAGLTSITLPVELNKGYNVIQMCSPYCWAPDIDAFSLKKL